MNATDRIGSFIATVRRVFRRCASARVSLYMIALLALFSVAVPLSAFGVSPRHGNALLLLAGLILGGALAGLLGAGLLRPFSRSRSNRSVARLVGRARPDIASDLMSAVEFAEVANAGRGVGAAHGSSELVDAFLADVSRRLDALEPRSVLPERPLRRAALSCAASLVCVATILLLAPSSVRAGWQRVLEAKDTRPFGGARMSDMPLIADVAITVTYPEYSGRPPLTLPSASGDVRAMAGSLLTLETRSLEPVLGARILFEDPSGARAGTGGQDGHGDGPSEVPFEVTDRHVLRASFRVRAPVRYRVLLEGLDGQRRVEAMTRAIEVEPDRAPEVELYAPGDKIDVASLKRIELAYIAEDDYGIARVDLVWMRDGERHSKPLLQEPGAQRSAQGKFLWDLAELSLEPGSGVSYFLEVADNDTVSGPNIGRSRELELRVFSPREKHEALVLRQRALLERMLRALAGRLTVAIDDLHAYQGLEREAADLVVELGTLAAGLREDGLADDDLRRGLEEMRSRLDGLVQNESSLLARSREPKARPGKSASTRLVASNSAFVGELEDDALTLANWIERQQMENLLAITDEVEVHQDRLQQLFKEYRRTGAPELLAEIEREMRSLEKRLAEMAEQRGHLADDVLDRFVHSDAIQEREATSCMDDVRALMREGKIAEAEAMLEQCMGVLDDATTAMERALSELRGETFSDEERRFAETMDRLQDLAYEQDEIAQAAQEIWDRYAARADELMREEAKETRKRVAKLLERLRDQVREIPESGLTPFAREEMDIVEARLHDVDRMLADGDIAEAMAMAEQARMSVETSAADMDAAMLEEQDEPWGESTQEARRDLGRVQSMLDRLVAELSASTPSPSEIMGRDERRRLERLGKRQGNLAERSQRLADKTRKMAGELPGRAGDALVEGVDAARSHMERANQRMRAQDPSGARQESQSAAEALQRAVEATRDAARGRRSLGRSGLRDEPIRIPGADEYKAPEKFREDILEAMKREQAPQGFDALVKRYYEELIR